MKPDASHTGPIATLECSLCHRKVEITQDDLHAFVHTGWPRCCGEIMAIRPAEGNPDDER